MYSTVQDVIKYTGIKYDNLGLSGKPELETMIGNWLEQIKSLIDRDRKRDLEKDLNFGDKITLINAEDLWEVDQNSVELCYDDIPLGTNNYAVNKFTILDDGEIATYNLDVDLSKSKTLDVYIKSSSATESGDIKIYLYKTVNKEKTIAKTCIVKSLAEDTWTLNRNYLIDATLTDITGIGIETSGISELYIGEVYTREIPKGIHNIAMRACANMVKLAYANRESPVVTIDDMSARLLEDQVLTAELKKELSLYPIKTELSFDRVRREDEEDEEEGEGLW